MAARNALGNRIAPVRFLAFLAVLAIAVPLLVPAIGWRHGTMAGFDLAAAFFLIAVAPLLRRADARAMRERAARNDANRALLLVVTAATMLAVLVAVGSELIEKGAPRPGAIALIVGTLMLAWAFSNMVYALHYAHIYYLPGATGGGDRGGLAFPGADEPNYRDFLYFSFTLGMTFQTSDVSVTATPVRIVVIVHSLAAFVFNLGVLAFTINVLGGS